MMRGVLTIKKAISAIAMEIMKERRAPVGIKRFM